MAYIDKITNKDTGESRPISPAADKVRVDNENFEGSDLDEVLDEIHDAIEDAGKGGYTPPAGGIPETDLAPAVQASLNKADTAVQDPNYVHTSNDYTSAEQTKLAGLPTGSDLNTALGNKANAADVYTKAQTDAAIQEAVEDFGGGTVESVTVNGTKHTPDANGDVNLGTIQGEKGDKGDKGDTVVLDPSQVEQFEIINDLTTGGGGDALSAEMGKELKAKITEVYQRVRTMYSLLGNIAFWDGKPATDTVLPPIQWNVPTQTVTLALSLTGSVVKYDGVTKNDGDTIQAEQGSTLRLTIEPTNNMYIFTSVPTSSTTGATVTDNGDGTYEVAVLIGSSSLTLSVSATAETYEIPTGGEMVFFLDGRDLTDGATAWADKIGNVQFSGSGTVVKSGNTPVGISFDGSTQGFSHASDLKFSPVDYTIEIVAIPANFNQYNYNYPFVNGTADANSGGRIESIYAILFKNGNTAYMNGVYVNGSGTVNQDGSWTAGHVWGMSYNVGDKVLIGANKNCAVKNGTSCTSTGAVHWNTCTGGAYLGKTPTFVGTGDLLSQTTVFAVRISRGHLTAAQMLHNQKIDNIRYKLGLTLPDSVS